MILEHLKLALFIGILHVALFSGAGLLLFILLVTIIKKIRNK